MAAVVAELSAESVARDFRGRSADDVLVRSVVVCGPATSPVAAVAGVAPFARDVGSTRSVPFARETATDDDDALLVVSSPVGVVDAAGLSRSASPAGSLPSWGKAESRPTTPNRIATVASHPV